MSKNCKVGIAKSMSSKIRHSGVIESIVGDCARVRIMQTSACAACKVASHCNAAESKEKLIDVYDGGLAQRYTVGQAVVVSTSQEVAYRALLLGFGVPLFLMVATLVVAICLSYGEGTAALASLAVLIPYYLILWVLRDRIRQKVSFQLENITKTN